MLFGGATILIGTLAYLFFPNVPYTGRLIAHFVVEPAALIAIFGSIGFVLIAREKQSITKINLSDTAAAVRTASGERQAGLDSLQGVVVEAASALAQRESGLRLTLMGAAGWAGLSSLAYWLLLRFEPSWLDTLDRLRTLL